MTTASTPRTIRLDALLTALVVSFAAGVAAVFAWRWFAVDVLDVPSDLSSLTAPSLIANAAIPVLGNGLGYFMSFRRPGRAPLLLFVGPSALLTCVGLAASILPLPTSSGAEHVGVTAVVVLITPVITVWLLLTRRNIRQAPRTA